MRIKQRLMHEPVPRRKRIRVLLPVSTGDQEHGATRILHVRRHHSRHEDAAQPAKEAWTNASRAPARLFLR